MTEKPQGYFKRLVDHPGIGCGVMLPLIAFFAGATNRNAKDGVETLLYGCVGFVGMFVLVWSIILISNCFKK